MRTAAKVQAQHRCRRRPADRRARRHRQRPHEVSRWPETEASILVSAPGYLRFHRWYSFRSGMPPFNLASAARTYAAELFGCPRRRRQRRGVRRRHADRRQSKRQRPRSGWLRGRRSGRHHERHRDRHRRAQPREYLRRDRQPRHGCRREALTRRWASLQRAPRCWATSSPAGRAAPRPGRAREAARRLFRRRRRRTSSRNRRGKTTARRRARRPSKAPRRAAARPGAAPPGSPSGRGAGEGRQVPAPPARRRPRRHGRLRGGWRPRAIQARDGIPRHGRPRRPLAARWLQHAPPLRRRGLDARAARRLAPLLAGRRLDRDREGAPANLRDRVQQPIS